MNGFSVTRCATIKSLHFIKDNKRETLMYWGLQKRCEWEVEVAGGQKKPTALTQRSFIEWEDVKSGWSSCLSIWNKSFCWWYYSAERETSFSSYGSLQTWRTRWKSLTPSIDEREIQLLITFNYNNIKTRAESVASMGEEILQNPDRPQWSIFVRMIWDDSSTHAVVVFNL